MPQFRAPLLFPDVAAWGIDYLGDRLAARREPYAAGVGVRSRVPDESAEDPWPASGRLVQVRDDGGSRSDFSRAQRIGVNVWADRGEVAECRDLAELVSALIDDSPGSGHVVAVVSTSAPVEVPDTTGRPHRYFTAELVLTGSALTA